MKTRINNLMTKSNRDYELVENNNTFILTLHTINGDFVFTLPKVYKENNVYFVDIGGVIRPIHSYMIIKNGKEIRMSFEDFIIAILFKAPELTGVMKGRTPVITRIYNIAAGRDENYTRYLVNTVQRFINRIVNETLPLHTTYMNSWAINNRIDIIDEEFKKIQDPNKKLKYQTDKADKYFDRGWSTMGLAESTLANRNYLLTIDLRKYAPFGIKHHNPQRNLYQTLGMKGEEEAIIQTKSQKKLSDMGIKRTGWAVPTVFLDLPLNFEDQILVDKESWENRTYSFIKSYTVYGKVFVKESDRVEYCDIIGISLDGHPVYIDALGEEIIIDKIITKHISIEGQLHEIYSVKVKITRKFKGGFKLTNLSGNKGIVKLINNLGIIHDPIIGDIKAQVIVSLSSVNKRKNFGQVCEAVLSRVIDDPIVIKDDAEFSIDKMRAALKSKGYTGNEPEVVNIETSFGTFKAIWGYVFWGCIKSPEDQLWMPGETFEVNSKGIRTTGLKFSTVEIRALATQFGWFNDDTINPVIEEVLSWQQGKNYLKSKIRSIQYLITDRIRGFYKTLNATDIKAVDITQGFMIPEEKFKGTICDPELCPDGFILYLPRKATVDISKNESKEVQKIFIPQASVRKYWQHSSGLYSSDTIGRALNYVIYCSQFKLDNLDIAVNSYFSALIKSLSTKKGEIAQLGMSVRYPYSVKATAALKNDLPDNTVEIHTSMADQLGVKTGDVVLVERFPCLGFMSVRPQYIQVTNDEQCRFVIRVANNSLVSEALDFDGDVIYIAAFKSKEANYHLRRLLMRMDLYTNKIINKINNKKVPQILDGGFDVCNVITFPKLTKEEHHTIVKRATGVKAHTGPVIALAYNLMRLVEGCIPYTETKIHADIEVLLDKLGNSVFAQKHGIRSLQEEATDSICCGDPERMFELGFDENSSKILCNIIRKEAKRVLGITNLKQFHSEAKKRGRSNIISRLIREEHKLYFTSRAILPPKDFYEGINSINDKDIPSFLFKNYLKTPTVFHHKQQNIDQSRTMIENLNCINKKNQLKNQSKILIDKINNIFKYKVFE